ncbi:MAG: LAGLIDADG family homing endonuclease [Candidatus Diapherotrites archaeon]
MSRLLLDKENRKLLFDILKRHYRILTVRQLAEKMGFSYQTLKTWQMGKYLVPARAIPKHILKAIKIDEIKAADWGKLKIQEMQKKDLLFLRRAKMQKKIKLLQNHAYSFMNRKIKLDNETVLFSHHDLRKGVTLPVEMTPELAEEIGMHIGDGTLPVKKYSYSLRGDILEEEYYTNHVQPLYKKVFGIKTRLLKRPPICGIEFDSKAIYTFKSRVLGLTIGEKKECVSVPRAIMDSDNPDVYKAFLRGIVDTDGCFYMPSTKQYPRVDICILSRPLIRDMDLILKRLGFMPSTSFKFCTIRLNGTVQFHKWMNEIGSKNPKHLKRIHQIKSLIPWKEIVKTIENSARVV